MIVLNELTETGSRRLELVADDVMVVTTLPGKEGSELRTIDGRVFRVAQNSAEVFTKLEESDGPECA